MKFVEIAKNVLTISTKFIELSMKFIEITLGRIGYLLNDKMMAFRSSGSAACNMAHVASGQVDIYYEDGFGGPWDVAAGICIIKESGGNVRGISGGAFQLQHGKGNIICGNKHVVNDVVCKIQAADSHRKLKQWRKLMFLTLGSTLVGCLLYSSNISFNKKSLAKDILHG